MVYLCFVSSLCAEENKEKSNPIYKSLHYKKTTNRSMSKFFRIEHIEKYLMTLNSSIQSANKFESDLLKAEISEVRTKLASAEERINELETQIKKLTKKINP